MRGCHVVTWAKARRYRVDIQRNCKRRHSAKMATERMTHTRERMLVQTESMHRCALLARFRSSQRYRCSCIAGKVCHLRATTHPLSKKLHGRATHLNATGKGTKQADTRKHMESIGAVCLPRTPGQPPCGSAQRCSRKGLTKFKQGGCCCAPPLLMWRRSSVPPAIGPRGLPKGTLPSVRVAGRRHYTRLRPAGGTSCSSSPFVKV